MRLASPMAGWLTSVRDVPDAVFSEEMMGIGVAIDPIAGVLVAPCDAEVVLVATTRHSVTLRTEFGVELLIHIGLETVALEGRGFEAHVRDGDRVVAGDPLISFDLDAVGLEAKSLATPIVLTNAGEFEWSLPPLNRLIEQGQALGSITGGQATRPLVGTAGETVTRDAVIRFEHGLHARPAARIADCAKRFSSSVTIACGEKSASARSPVAIMALDARHGTTARLSATGTDAEAALDAIVSVLEAGEPAERSAVASITTRTLADNEIGGVCALPGAVVGKALHWRRRASETVEQGRGVEQETAALQEAQGKVHARLEGLAAQSDGAAAGIARAHMALLDDEELNSMAGAEIAQGRSAARAWQVATAAATDALRASDSALVRERVADLDDICAQIVAALSGEEPAKAVELGERTILLADELLPSELMALPREQLAGLAMSGGGPTSHVAIIAASFGIPTLVAMGPQLARVPEGASVLLDANAGVLAIDPDQNAQERAAATCARVDTDADCITRDGERVRLLANLGGAAEVEAALAAGAEGCGLLRTEFLFLDRAKAPSEDEQRGVYQAIADALGDRPLTIRTLDIGGDKPVQYIRFPDEQNPALGARGIRTGLFEPGLLNEQLRAIAEVRGKNIKIMLPMISSVSELRAVRDRLGDLTLGVMVETPAAALIADRLAAEADFLSIGSNDLAQYTLAMDRTNPLLAASIDALHPAVLRLIGMTADAGRKAGKPISLCGSLGSEPIGALVLVGLGLRELSAVPAALPAVRHALRQVSATDCQALAKRALGMESAAEVRALAATLLQGDPR